MLWANNIQLGIQCFPQGSYQLLLCRRSTFLFADAKESTPPLVCRHMGALALAFRHGTASQAGTTPAAVGQMSCASQWGSAELLEHSCLRRQPMGILRVS